MVQFQLKISWTSYDPEYNIPFDVYGEQYAEYDVSKDRLVGIKRDLAVDPENRHIFLLSGTKVRWYLYC